MRANFHGRLFMCKAACFKYCRQLLFTLTWLSISSVSFLASTNVRTICVVTVRIDIANMVAIATLIDIWEQKWIAETLLDRDKHQISEFLKKEFCFICGKLRSAICKVLCNDYTLAWVCVPSVSFLTGADVGAVSVGTIRSHVTSMASIEALIDIW